MNYDPSTELMDYLQHTFNKMKPAVKTFRHVNVTPGGDTRFVDVGFDVTWIDDSTQLFKVQIPVATFNSLMKRQQ